MMIAIHDASIRPTLAVHLLRAEAKLFAEGMRAAGYKGAVPTDAEHVARVCAVIEQAVPGLAGKLAEKAAGEVLCVVVSETFDARVTRVSPLPGSEPEPAAPSRQSPGQAPSQADELEDMMKASLEQGVPLSDLAAPVRAVLERMLGKADWREAPQPPGPVLSELTARGVVIPTHAAQINVGPGELRCLKLSDGSVLVNRGDLEGFARVFVRT